MAFLVGSTAPPNVRRLAVPAVCILIAFLGYGSQVLFATSPDLSPGPLTATQNYTFNILLLCLWVTYYRACTTDPGRYTFPPPPKTKKTTESRDRPEHDAGQVGEDGDDVEEVPRYGQDERTTTTVKRRKRWCKKCQRPKPPRAHHCKICNTCIPKMDHHCPWTANCVSLQTLPHFVRFLVYANLSLWTLLYLLSQRFYSLWQSRHLPAYLGPSFAQLTWLTVLAFVGGVTTLLLGIILMTGVGGWAGNVTMIEEWEIERHESLLDRAATTGPDGSWWTAGEGAADSPRLSVEPVEFPYDLGYLANMAEGMGTSNPLLWLWPFAGHPVVASNADGRCRGLGWEYEENGLNDREDMWPPIDPDKARHAKLWRERRQEMEAERYDHEAAMASRDPEVEVDAFRQRQARDLARWQTTPRDEIMGELEEREDYDFVDEAYADSPNAQSRRRPDRAVVMRGARSSGWVNNDGEQLADYGVDEDAELDEPIEDDDDDDEEGDGDDDDDNVPIAELIRRRKVLTKDGEET